MEKLRARRAELVAISVDPPETSKALMAKLGVTFPLLSDVDRSTIRAYGVEDEENRIAWPAIFIVAPDGTIRWRDLAETYKERPTSEVILQALAELVSERGQEERSARCDSPAALGSHTRQQLPQLSSRSVLEQ